MTPYYLWQMIHISYDVLPSRQQSLCPLYRALRTRLQTAHYARCDAFQALPSLQILEEPKVHKIRKITPCIIFLPSKKCRIPQITLFKSLFLLKKTFRKVFSAKSGTQNGQKTTKTLFEKFFQKYLYWRLPQILRIMPYHLDIPQKMPNFADYCNSARYFTALLPIYQQ